MQVHKILFFLACWRRPEITELCFMGLKRLMKYNSRATAFAVISEEDMIPLCEKYGIKYVIHENEPVGRKKNFGLSQAMKEEYDYIIELGSDDLILNSIFDIYKPYMDKGMDWFGVNRTLYIDAVTMQCNDYTAEENQYGFGFGLGRCLSRRLLESLSGNVKVKGLTGVYANGEILGEGSQTFLPPAIAESLEKQGHVEILDKSPNVYLWSDHINRVMDNDSSQRMMNKGYKYHAIETQTPIVVDVKSDEGIWKFNPELGKKGNLDQFMEKLSKEEKAKFLENSKKLKARRLEFA